MTNSDIEIKILELFCSDKTGPFKAVDVQRILPALVRPGMAVAVMSGEYEVPDNSGIIKETAKVVVSVVVKNVATESERRKTMHPAVSYVVRKLHNNDLGLDIEPLEAKGWREVTDENYLSEGVMVCELEFKTSIDVHTEESEKEYRVLESIMSSFTEGEETVLEGEMDFNKMG